MKILIIDGSEKRIGRSEGNLTKSLVNHWVKKLRVKNEVIITQVSDGYFAQEERNKFMNVDLVIFQFPVYWFSMPGSTKKYIDDVFDSNHLYEHSKNYGQGGLLDSKYILSSTWNAPFKEFSNKEGFFDGLCVDQVFISIHKSFEYIGMKKLATVHNHEVLSSTDVVNYKNKIDELIMNLKLT